jgi:hypothetical protein
MDLREFKYAPDQAILGGIGLIALVYVGTGPTAWSEGKWQNAVSGAMGAVAALKAGQLIGRKEGWDDGYNTLNPALRVEEMAAFTLPPAPVQITPFLIDAQQRDPRGAAASLIDDSTPAPVLPAGWTIDERGRYRDVNGRIASEARMIYTLSQETAS